jgi:mycoredoxin
MAASMLIMYGTNWCGDCFHTKKLLEKLDVQYKFINIDFDKEAERFVLDVNHGMRSVPTLVFEDGSILIEPSDKALSEKLGLAYEQTYG